MSKIQLRFAPARATLFTLTAVSLGSLLLTGCSKPEETPSPSPSADAATGTAAPSAANTAKMPGGTQGDAAYYSRTYGGAGARPAK